MGWFSKSEKIKEKFANWDELLLKHKEQLGEIKDLKIEKYKDYVKFSVETQHTHKNLKNNYVIIKRINYDFNKLSIKNFNIWGGYAHTYFEDFDSAFKTIINNIKNKIVSDEEKFKKKIERLDIIKKNKNNFNLDIYSNEELKYILG